MMNFESNNNDSTSSVREALKVEPIEEEAETVGRNDPCPCGSGQKYKKCCGATASQAN